MAELLSRLLVEWMQKRQIQNDEKFTRKLWDELDDLFKELAAYMTPDPEIIQVSCSGEDGNTTQFIKRNKDLCKALMKMFYFMEWWDPKTGKEKKDDEDRNEKDLKSYLRCVVGRAAMLKMFGQRCDLQPFVEYISDKISILREGFRAGDSSSRCSWVDFNSQKIGTQLIGEKMEKWVKEEKDKATQKSANAIKGLHSLMAGGKTGSESCTYPFEKITVTEPKDNLVEWIEGKKQLKELQDVMNKGEYMKEEKVKTVLQKVKERIDEREKKIKGVQYKCLKSTSASVFDDEKELTIWEWFTHFSRNVSDDDKTQYEELESMLDLCDPVNDDKNIGLDRYEYFCKITMRNIMIVTEVGKQYKDLNQQQGEAPCQKEVKGITLCELLRVWIWYMVWFCVPKEVIQYAFKGVESVRGDLYKGKKYAECTYGEPNIPHRDAKAKADDVYHLFHTSRLYQKIKGDTNETWCENHKWQERKKAPAGEPRPRAETGARDGIINDSGPKDVKKIIEKIQEGIEQEEEKDTKKLKDIEETINEAVVDSDKQVPVPTPPPAPAPPPKLPEKPKEEVVPEEEEEEASKEEPASKELTNQTDDPGTRTDTQPQPVPLPASQLRKRINQPNLTSYLPLAPAVLGISFMSYLLWKYFGMLRKTRKRYRRAHQGRGPPSLEQQIVDHVDQPVPRAYYIVKERKPRSTAIKRMKKRIPGRRGGVRRRMIIDIHLEVLEECQKGDLHSLKEDFFGILVQEFMGPKFIKQEKAPKESVPSSESGFREEDFVPREDVPKEDVPKERVPSSDSGF